MKGRYGSPRIAKGLRMQGLKVSQSLVARIMKKKNLRSLRVQRFKQMTNSKHTYPIVDNRLAQDFNTRDKNQVWVSNITYIMSGKGNCYDNAVAESFFKTIKSEIIYQNMYKSRKDAYYSVFEYIEGFYNTNRRHSHLGYLTIKEFNELHKFNDKKQLNDCSL